jgi:hypothetical protein
MRKLKFTKIGNFLEFTEMTTSRIKSKLSYYSNQILKHHLSILSLVIPLHIDLVVLL